MALLSVLCVSCDDSSGTEPGGMSDFVDSGKRLRKDAFNNLLDAVVLAREELWVDSLPPGALEEVLADFGWNIRCLLDDVVFPEEGIWVVDPPPAETFEEVLAEAEDCGWNTRCLAVLLAVLLCDEGVECPVEDGGTFD
ncbi:hypothetical protein C8R44DRAFT_747147 [Mycena epipterygia]|nr:hypothetical protein C8R44DRAFT_747147 [Mycena epipterygia]